MSNKHTCENKIKSKHVKRYCFYVFGLNKKQIAFKYLNLNFLIAES